ncbi:hypothetical protein [Smaragdicoccus niigatensis]|uniref:hypothetical protein n=1 Tax=Smaragdicoccus niigatensis TaxID=359359 RepID=UPI0003695F0E|nr:hypothetical protein [Smaragdicoccus niigatensis]
MTDAASEVAHELGGPMPSGFRALSEEKLRWLATTLSHAKQAHLDELDASTERAVARLPLMLRGPVRGILGGTK